ncbi:MAG: peptidylprolyl isomerase [Bacteroidetes bacterium]|nr:MAG: peptidylprolyl isomerase [Bacteroidota bacterium]
MAIITKIREKSGLAIGVVLVALGLFIVGGDLISPNSKLFGKGETTVGEINGEKIPVQQYSAVVQELVGKYTINLGRQPNEGEMDYIRKEAWNELIYRTAFQKEFDKLGLTVSKDEVKDLVTGNNPHPFILRQFTNPKTGEFDRAVLNNYLQNLPKMQQEERIQFYQFELSLTPERLKKKYADLFNFSTYVSKQEAQNEYRTQNTRIDAKYVLLPYASVSDSLVKITDSDLQTYFNQNKNKYKAEATRSLEYVVFPLKPSSKDSANTKKEIESLIPEFEEAKNDTNFVDRNNDAGSPFKAFRKDDLPKELASLELQKGKVYGPFMADGRLKIHKFIDSKEDTAFSAKASHILFEVKKDTSNKAKSDSADAIAKKTAEDILKRIKEGADFAFMASQYGSDGTAEKGGDLGWFTQGKMVKEFENAVFASTNVGLLPNLVKTEFGYHIVKVTSQKTKTKYQVATVVKDFEPSEETTDVAYALAGEFSNCKNVTEYADKLKATKNMISLQALNLKKDARSINNLQGTKVREVLRWAFDEQTGLGEVSKIFQLDDSYIVTLLRGKTEEGEPKFEDFKDQVRKEVLIEKKAEYIFAKINGKANSLEDMIKAYENKDINIETTENFSLQTVTLKGIGAAPVAIGKASAMKKGEKTTPFREASGIVMLEVISSEAAPEIADFATYKQKIAERRTAQTEYFLMEAIKKLANVKEDLLKYN